MYTFLTNKNIYMYTYTNFVHVRRQTLYMYILKNQKKPRKNITYKKFVYAYTYTKHVYAYINFISRTYIKRKTE